MMSKFKNAKLGVLLAGASVLGLFPAVARGKDAVAQEKGEGADTERYDRDEIIVTAQRREQNVRDVPMSLAVLGGEKLVNQGIAAVQRLSDSPPNPVVGGQGGPLVVVPPPIPGARSD